MLKNLIFRVGGLLHSQTTAEKNNNLGYDYRFDTLVVDSKEEFLLNVIIIRDVSTSNSGVLIKYL